MYRYFTFLSLPKGNHR